MDSHSIAEIAARVLSEERPSVKSHDYQIKSRQILREPAVRALRWLWKTGDPEQRLAVAARVLVWCGRAADFSQAYNRIAARERERARLAAEAQK